MNDLLAGRRGAIAALRDARGRTMLADGVADTEPGATVHLTLDRSIQAIAETALAEAVTTNHAKSGVAVVLDVATSRVLAMASVPSYDPNSDARPARDRAVVDTYEAGSVMKVFGIAAALDAGVVAPDTELDLGGGQLKIGPKVIRDLHNDPYLTVAGVIKRSSNVGAAKIALKFGREHVYAALKRFGFGARTGIELPGEQAGTLRDGRKWHDIDLATIAYGYGLTVTPLQIAAALAAIGNGGLYREPRVVDRVADSDGVVLYRGHGDERRVISEKTAEQMLAMLASVFDKGKQPGTAASIVVPGFRCGGKTGTAYKYDPETKQYALDRYLSSFAGLAPIDHPRLAIVVLVDDPMGGDHYGGKVAGPVFAAIASEALRYLGVPGEPITK
jgi:cell division protein FtsI (penicillin-binding protein 3)